MSLAGPVRARRRLKDYRGLRPLRIERLTLAAGEQVALLGFDQPAAEVFVNLITGATLPDPGEVRVLGRPTAAITDSADWLAASIASASSASARCCSTR